MTPRGQLTGKKGFQNEAARPSPCAGRVIDSPAAYLVDSTFHVRVLEATASENLQAVTSQSLNSDIELKGKLFINLSSA